MGEKTDERLGQKPMTMLDEMNPINRQPSDSFWAVKVY